jgi:hypothetical protein
MVASLTTWKALSGRPDNAFYADVVVMPMSSVSGLVGKGIGLARSA